MSVTDGNEVEHSSCDCEPGESNEHHSDDRVPDERRITPQGGDDILAIHHHDLALQKRARGQGNLNLSLNTKAANNFYVKLCVISGVSGHACHDGKARKPYAGVTAGNGAP
jgi:hypothetical protein